MGSGLTLSDALAAAAVKDGGQHLLNGGIGATAFSRMACGALVVPRAADLDEEAVSRLPPKLQFEILDEVKLAERKRRRDELVHAEHTASSFSHAQLENYVEMSKVCIYTYIYRCIYVYIDVYIDIYICMYIYLCIYIYTSFSHAQLENYVEMSKLCTYTYEYVYMYICIGLTPKQIKISMRQTQVRPLPCGEQSGQATVICDNKTI